MKPHCSPGTAVRIGVLATALLGLAGCGFGDLFRTAGPRTITIDYTGSSIIVIGSPAPFTFTVTADGVPVPNPRLSLESSDTSIFIINSTRDSLIPLQFGSATLTARLNDPAFTDSIPALDVHIRVRN
jgi:hypothetical protein